MLQRSADGTWRYHNGIQRGELQVSIPRDLRCIPKAIPYQLAPGEERTEINELCRQIDVFKRLQADYSADWKPDKDAPLAAPEVVAGAACVLLINAEPAAAGSDGDGWALKCLNSALKVIEQHEQLPMRAELNAWAQSSFSAAVARAGSGAAQ